MKSFAAFLCLCLAAMSARAQVASATTSRSGQFVIYAVDANAPRPLTTELATNLSLVRLEPTLLSVSCERIKSELLGELKVADTWRGKIFLALHPFQSSDEDILVTAERFGDGWNYRMELPDAVAPERLVRAVTQVLLLEMANRNARERSAALPAWLAEGMPQLLLAGSDIDLVVQAGHPEARVSQHPNLFKLACERLHGHPPLTLAQLAQPPADWNGEDAEIFRASSLLFLHELLQLSNGGASLAAALPELAWDPDWRVALLRGFHEHFKREVDLEKWWALQSAFAASRTAEQKWSQAETLKKLGAILRCQIEVAVTPNEPPMQTDVPLQTIIQGWDFSRQADVLREKIRQLAAAELRADRNLNGLIEQYRHALETYLHERADDAHSSLKNQVERGQSAAPAFIHRQHSGDAKDLLLQLNILDQRREAWAATLEKSP